MIFHGELLTCAKAILSPQWPDSPIIQSDQKSTVWQAYLSNQEAGEV